MIYFIQAEDKGIKIGKTELEAEVRLIQMQVCCPLELTLLGSVKGEEKREEELHERFSKARIRGEWFSIDIKEEVEVLINAESSIESRRLHAINRAIGGGRNINSIHKLVHKKEILLKYLWSVGNEYVV